MEFRIINTAGDEISLYNKKNLLILGYGEEGERISSAIQKAYPHVDIVPCDNIQNWGG